jgi:alpha-amylase
MRFFCLVAGLAAMCCSSAIALSPADWRKQSIYQLLTDRFARTDGSTTATCDSGAGIYCGGTWQGIIKKLDYIQSLGVTAVWISPFVKQMDGSTLDGFVSPLPAPIDSPFY